ncbi:MAG: glycosyltransferase family 39 protein [Nitrospinota bacterium]
MKSQITLFLFFVSVYCLTSQGSIQSSDGKIMYLLTQAMVEEQSLSFSESVTDLDSKEPQYSKYGLGMSVLAMPFYLLGKGLSAVLGIEESMATQFTVSMINALLTALSCVMVFSISLKRLNFRYSTGLFLSLGFGLSTIAWYYSEDFMSEPATTLFLLCAVYFATDTDESRKKKTLLLAGTFLAIAIFCRMASLLAVPGFVIYQWMVWKNSGQREIREFWEDIFRAALPVILIMMVIMSYNYIRFEDVFESGYEKDGFGGNFFTGLYGILLSPGKSLFLYNPLTLLGCFAFTWFWVRDKKLVILFGWLVISHLLMFSFWHSWPGGMGWGPRLMLVVVPYLILPVGYLWEEYANKAKIPLVAALLLGIMIQIPSLMVNASRYYYEMSQKFGPSGHEILLFSARQSPLIGQFKQVAIVFEKLNDDLQMEKMVSFARDKKKFLGEDINVVLENGLAVNSPNFWWYYMRLFGYSFIFWLVPPLLFAGLMIVSGYQLIKELK